MKYIKIFFFLIILNSFNCDAQNYTHDFQSWTRFQFQYKTENAITISQVENRFDYLTNKSFMQTRFQITNNFDQLQTGCGITFRPGEFRLHEIASFDIHKITFEQRFFKNNLLYRLRYMLYSEIKLDDSHSIHTGFETMLQCSNTEVIKPEQIRIMLDYSISLHKNYKIKIGYMACIFQNYTITHVLRLTTEFDYTKN